VGFRTAARQGGVNAIAGGDGGAGGDPFLRLYRETVEPLYRSVARRARSRDLAEDVVQETFLRAVTHFARAGVPREPLAWLRAVARNLLRSHFRRSTPVATAAGVDLDRLLAPEDRRDDSAAALLECGLARLKDGEARLLEEFHVEGRTMKEIAADRRWSERAVEGRLARARAALARVLAHQKGV